MKKGSSRARSSKQAIVKDYGELTAKNLKGILWGCLKGLRSGAIRTNEADAVATQAREILRVTSTQLRIASQAKRPIPNEVIDFSEKA